MAVCAGLPVALGLSWGFGRLLQRLHGPLDELAREQVAVLDQLPAKRVELAIAASAALSLFFELAVIRWQGTVWEFFAFYKNLGLLSCFAGPSSNPTLVARPDSNGGSRPRRGCVVCAGARGLDHATDLLTEDQVVAGLR
jgi:hypothetical protein